MYRSLHFIFAVAGVEPRTLSELITLLSYHLSPCGGLLTGGPFAPRSPGQLLNSQSSSYALTRVLGSEAPMGLGRPHLEALPLSLAPPAGHQSGKDLQKQWFTIHACTLVLP